MYENGSRIPDLKTLTAIADFFNVGLDQLSGHEKNTTDLPTAYQDMKVLIARNGNNLSDSEKMKLIRLLSDM